MRAYFRPSDLIPAELNVEAVHHRPDGIVVAPYRQFRGCRSPECGTISHRVHSRYPRMITDLPCAGRRSNCTWWSKFVRAPSTSLRYKKSAQVVSAAACLHCNGAIRNLVYKIDGCLPSHCPSDSHRPFFIHSYNAAAILAYVDAQD